MFAPPVCFTCGCPVGDVALLYRAIVRGRHAAALAKAGLLADSPLLAHLKEDCSDVFLLLGVQRDCCRMVIASTMYWVDTF